MGLTDIEIQRERFGDTRCLIVSRFDRFETPRGYSEFTRRTSARRWADPATELDHMVAIVVFTVLIGNADAHGKNLALLHTSPEALQIARSTTPCQPPSGPSSVPTRRCR